MKWPLQNELDWSQQEFTEQGVCGQCRQLWLSLWGRKKAQALSQRRSQFSLADEMNTAKTIRECYRHSCLSLVLLCAQHLNLLSICGEFSTLQVLMTNSLCPDIEGKKNPDTYFLINLENESMVANQRCLPVGSGIEERQKEKKTGNKFHHGGRSDICLCPGHWCQRCQRCQRQHQKPCAGGVSDASCTVQC